MCTDQMCSDSAFQIPAQPTHHLEASYTDTPAVTQIPGLVTGEVEPLLSVGCVQGHTPASCLVSPFGGCLWMWLSG